MQRSLRFKKPESKRIYKRRTKTVEPFNSWFKSLFALDRAWHRGLANNQTQILAAIFCYQALVRYNFRLNKTGSSRILVGAEGGFHAQFSAVEEDSNAEVLELAEAFGS